MKEYPLNKYKFHVFDNVVVAESTFAGRRIKGYAKCHPQDIFNLEIGKRLAAARCNLKVADIRAKTARKTIDSINEELHQINNKLDRKTQYYKECIDSQIDAKMKIDDILSMISPANTESHDSYPSYSYREELLNKYKQLLIMSTNIESSEDEMECIDNILYRFWQLGWLDKLESNRV